MQIVPVRARKIGVGDDGRVPHPVQEQRKTRIASQRVESGIHPDERESIRAVAVGAIQPGEGIGLVAEHRIHDSDVVSADISLRGDLFHPVQ